MHLDQGMDRAECVMNFDETARPIFIGCRSSSGVILMRIFGGVRVRPCHVFVDPLRAEGPRAMRRNPRLRAGNPWQEQGQCINKIFAHVSPQRAPSCCISAFRPGCRPLSRQEWAIRFWQYPKRHARCLPAL